MPAAHAIQRHYSPRHAVHRSNIVPAAARQRDCVPGAVLAGGALTPMAPIGLDGGAAATPPAAIDGFPFGAPAAARVTPISAGGGYGGDGFNENGGGGGYYSGGGGTPGGGGGGGGTPGGGGGTPPIDGGGSTPSPLPEPASWALMVIGFGTLGGALRLRQASVRKREVVEVEFG